MKTISFSALALLASTAALHAGTVSNVSIVENIDGISTVTDASVSNGNASASGTTFFSESVATQNSDGTSAVRATAGSNGFQELTTSTASFEQDETNTSGGSLDYTLNYTLAGQEAELFPGFGIVALASGATQIAPSNPLNPFTGAGLPSNMINVTAASFQYDIEVDGMLVFTARADAIMDQSGNVVLDAVQNFMPTLASGTFGSTVFSVDGISGSIFLGSRAAGTTIDVTSTLTARAYAEGIPIDGFVGGSVNVRSRDPITLSSIGTLSSTPTIVVNPSPVPLPAAAWMLIAGLGGLGVLRKRAA